MRIDFGSIEEKQIANFKGGMQTFRTRMFDDGSAKIMYGTLEPGASIGLHTHETNSEIIYVRIVLSMMEPKTLCFLQ